MAGSRPADAEPADPAAIMAATSAAPPIGLLDSDHQHLCNRDGTDDSRNDPDQ
jgi:hypothetical protein